MDREIATWRKVADGDHIKRIQEFNGGTGVIHYFAEEYGEFKFCLELHPQKSKEWQMTTGKLHLDVERQYQDDAEELIEETRDAITRTLQKTLRKVKQIKMEQRYYKKREQEFRSISWLTANRVIWFGALTALTVIACGCFMVQNLPKDEEIEREDVGKVDREFTVFSNQEQYQEYPEGHVQDNVGQGKHHNCHARFCFIRIARPGNLALAEGCDTQSTAGHHEDTWGYLRAQARVTDNTAMRNTEYRSLTFSITPHRLQRAETPYTPAYPWGDSRGMEKGTAPKRDVITSFAAIARNILAERDFRWESRIRIIMRGVTAEGRELLHALGPRVIHREFPVRPGVRLLGAKRPNRVFSHRTEPNRI
eukprot:sb/3465920/